MLKPGSRATTQAEMSVNGSAMRVFAIAALALCQILAGCRPTLAQTSAPVGAALPRPPVLAQAHSAPTAQIAPAAPPDQPIGLPRVRDYEPIPELRDIYFDFGTAVMRRGDEKILDANAAWLRANPGQLVLIEGHCDNRGATSTKNEFNMDLGERRAQAAMNHLIAQGVHPSRITILSYGEERPQCTENSERCWSQNRRSRFLVKPR
jgi:peptidoglycan-associated lipoprotein